MKIRAPHQPPAADERKSVRQRQVAASKARLARRRAARLAGLSDEAAFRERVEGSFRALRKGITGR